MPTTYILMLLFSVVMLLIAQKFKDNKIVKITAYILGALSFFVVSAIRYDVGTDYFYRYAPDYIKLGQGIDVTNLEIGYKAIVSICLLITKDYAIIFAVTSAIIIGLTFYTIYKESPYPVLSVIIYFGTGFFFHSLNLMRQYIAISIVLYSYKYLIKKEYIEFILCIILACLMHSISLVFIIAILLCDREVFDLKRTIIISILLLIFGKYIWHYVIDLIVNHTRFAVYIGSKFDKSKLRIYDIIFNAILYIIIYYLYKHTKEKGRTEKFFLNMQACSLFFMILASTMYLLFRFSFFFGIFNIISIPYFLEKSDIDKKKKIAVLVILIITLCGYITKTNIIGNTDEVKPYKTIFNIKNRKYIN